MSKNAQRLLEEFDSLAETERREVAVEILRRTDLVSYGAPEDSELLAAADQIFLELDRRESRG
jgi:hypothetical protein